MADKLRAAEVSATAVIVEGVGHGWWEGEKQTKSIERAVDFFDRHLKK
jgi:dipeptidyl aminopeptidase/acylaminoacyl peptidase